MHTPNLTKAETLSGPSKSLTQPLERTNLQASHNHTPSNNNTLTNSTNTSLTDREVLVVGGEGEWGRMGGSQTPPLAHVPREKNTTIPAQPPEGPQRPPT